MKTCEWLDPPGMEQSHDNYPGQILALKAEVENLKKALEIIAKEADREAKNIGPSARRGDQSKADTFRFIRDTAEQQIESLMREAE